MCVCDVCVHVYVCVPRGQARQSPGLGELPQEGAGSHVLALAWERAAVRRMHRTHEDVIVDSRVASRRTSGFDSGDAQYTDRQLSTLATR